MTIHQPVLLDEVLFYLSPTTAGSYVDGTLGEGGHAEAILERASPGGRLLGIDRDPGTLARARARLSRFGDRVELMHGSYAEIPTYLERHDWVGVDGIVVDLGLNTMQLDDPKRGFSFAREGPLDMRFDPTAETTAADLVNHLGERDLADLIFRYGEERRSRAIARRIVSSRPLETTSDLRRAVLSALGGKRRGGIDPATRTFQALRIAVNRELSSLAGFLEKATLCLNPGGRVVVISYHSLEDREVKWSFRERAKAEEGPPFRILTRKPVRPSPKEVELNRRARSAKLRVLERVDSN
jgi:16S rRNA (cytosine1402-N4)-methyltransferase